MNTAVVAELDGRVHRVVVPLPSPLPNQAVVRVAFGGICGSDLHYWKHGRVGESVMTEPLVLGHETVGIVESAATDGSGPSVGSPVFVHPAIVCGHCQPCRAGRENLCLNLRYMGSAARVPHTPGGFADRVVIDSARLLPVDGIALDTAALIEPASVAWHAVDRAARLVNLDRARITVIGSGPIGLLCIAVVRARFPEAQILAADLQQWALDAAASIGAHETIAAGRLAERSGEAEIVIESSGSPSGLRAAIEVVAPGGTVVAVGQLPDAVPVPMHRVVGREIDLVGSSRFFHEAGPVIEALRQGTLRIDAAVSHRFVAAEVVEAFKTAADPSRSSKVLIDFRDGAASDDHADDHEEKENG